MARWRSIRLGGGAGRFSPLRGRPRLCLGFGFGAGLSDFAGFSRASIAVLSREICPTRRSACLSWINASCNRDGKALLLNSAKARENVASLGTSPARCQPHSRRNVLSTDSISINSRVVGKLNTAFRDKGSCQCRTFRQRAPGQAGPAGQERLDPGHAKNADQLPVMFVQRATGRVVEPGQKFLLNVEPVCG